MGHVQFYSSKSLKSSNPCFLITICWLKILEVVDALEQDLQEKAYHQKEKFFLIVI